MRATENGTITNVGIDKKRFRSFCARFNRQCSRLKTCRSGSINTVFLSATTKSQKRSLSVGFGTKTPNKSKPICPPWFFENSNRVSAVHASNGSGVHFDYRKPKRCQPSKNLIEPVEWDGVSRLPEIFVILGISGDELSKTLVKNGYSSA